MRQPSKEQVHQDAAAWNTANHCRKCRRKATIEVHPSIAPPGRMPSRTLVFSVSAVEQLKWGRCAYSKATRGADGACSREGGARSASDGPFQDSRRAYALPNALH